MGFRFDLDRLSWLGGFRISFRVLLNVHFRRFFLFTITIFNLFLLIEISSLPAFIFTFISCISTADNNCFYELIYFLSCWLNTFCFIFLLIWVGMNFTFRSCFSQCGSHYLQCFYWFIAFIFFTLQFAHTILAETKSLRLFLLFLAFFSCLLYLWIFKLRVEFIKKKNKRLIIVKGINFIQLDSIYRINLAIWVKFFFQIINFSLNLAFL